MSALPPIRRKHRSLRTIKHYFNTNSGVVHTGGAFIMPVYPVLLPAASAGFGRQSDGLPVLSPSLADAAKEVIPHGVRNVRPDCPPVP